MLCHLVARSKARCPPVNGLSRLVTGSVEVRRSAEYTLPVTMAANKRPIALVVDNEVEDATIEVKAAGPCQLKDQADNTRSCRLCDTKQKWRRTVSIEVEDPLPVVAGATWGMESERQFVLDGTLPAGNPWHFEHECVPCNATRTGRSEEDVRKDLRQTRSQPSIDRAAKFKQARNKVATSNISD
jgi:hypothetical protein